MAELRSAHRNDLHLVPELVHSFADECNVYQLFRTRIGCVLSDAEALEEEWNCPSGRVFTMGCMALGLAALHTRGVLYRGFEGACGTMRFGRTAQCSLLTSSVGCGAFSFRARTCSSPPSVSLLTVRTPLHPAALDARGYVILINFNWARRLREGEAAETLCGEPDYMAPEVVRASGHGMAADWWGLGVRLYWMVTGASPWSMGMGIVQNEISTFQSITAHQPGERQM